MKFQNFLQFTYKNGNITGYNNPGADRRVSLVKYSTEASTVALGDVPVSGEPRATDSTNLSALWSLLALSALGSAILVLTRKKRDKDA